MRAKNGTGVLRLGVKGILSPMISANAAIDRTQGVHRKPKNASQVSPMDRYPNRAAQLTTAGAAMLRSPDTTPIKKAKRMIRTGPPFSIRDYSEPMDIRIAKAILGLLAE
jgi:hypothetical protein